MKVDALKAHKFIPEQLIHLRKPDEKRMSQRKNTNADCHTHAHTQYIQSSHRQTHTSAKFSRKGEGFVSNNGHNRFSTPPRLGGPKQSSFLHRVSPVQGGGGGDVGGDVMIPTNSTNTTTTTKAMSCNKIGQTIEHANRLRKSTWQTKENSVNSAFGEDAFPL